MPVNYDRRDGGYKLPAITDPDRICIQLEIPNDPEHKAAFWGALWTLTWYNAWQKDEAKRGKDVAAVWRDVWLKARDANVDWDACINCDEDGCIEYSPQFIQEWYPNNPYISVPDGLVKKWYIAPDINLLGVPAGAVVTDILQTAPGGDGDFIRCRFTFSGTGRVEIHWHTIHFGGLAQVQVDSDITKIYYVELGSDPTAAPPEPTTSLQTEYDFTAPGQHHIDITMIPQIKTDIEAVGYGGGIVKIVMCGFDDMVITPKFRFTEACGLEQSNDNGATWTSVEGWDTFAPTCFTGADGPPIELRVYFGTVQWRVVGDVWNHLINLDEICDCEEPDPVNPNPLSEGLLCSISKRIAAVIRNSWNRAFVYSDLLNDTVAGITEPNEAHAAIWPSIPLVTDGLKSFVGWINSIAPLFGYSEQTDFTNAVEDFIASLIYCELTRREQLTIDRDVILDIAPNLQNAPDLDAAQKTSLISLVLAMPQLLLTSTALLSTPLESGAACESTCPDDDEAFWCFNFFSDSPVYDGLMASHPLIESGLLNLQIGRLETEAEPAYIAQSRTGYPFLPDAGDAYPSREIRIIVNFPRPTLIDGLSIDVLYNQTNAVASGRLVRIVSDDGTVLMNHDTSGVTGTVSSVSFQWWGEKQVSSLTITGQIWANHAWADVFAKLQYTGLKIQGREYAPFKPFNNCIWQPSLEPDEPAHDWSATFNFANQDWGFYKITGGSSSSPKGGVYIEGVGWKSELWVYLNTIEHIHLNIMRDGTLTGVTAGRLMWSFSRANDVSLSAIMDFASTPTDNMNFPTDDHSLRYDQIEISGTTGTISFRANAGTEGTSGTDWSGSEGEIVVREIKIWGTGTRPAALDGVPD